MLHLYIQVHIGHVTAKLNERLESHISIAKFKIYYAEFFFVLLEIFPRISNLPKIWKFRLTMACALFFSPSSVYAQASDFHFSPSVQ